MSPVPRWSTNWSKRPTSAGCHDWWLAMDDSTCCCLDELGYVQLDARGAELLFQILTEREEKASVATASNLPFSEWGQVIGDPRLVAAIVDRMTFSAHIIETGTESFRLRSTKAKRATKASLISAPAAARRWLARLNASGSKGPSIQAM